MLCVFLCGCIKNAKRRKLRSFTEWKTIIFNMLTMQIHVGWFWYIPIDLLARSKRTQFSCMVSELVWYANIMCLICIVNMIQPKRDFIPLFLMELLQSNNILNWIIFNVRLPYAFMAADDVREIQARLMFSSLNISNSFAFYEKSQCFDWKCFVFFISTFSTYFDAAILYNFQSENRFWHSPVMALVNWKVSSRTPLTNSTVSNRMLPIDWAVYSKASQMDRIIHSRKIKSCPCERKSLLSTRFAIISPIRFISIMSINCFPFRFGF